MVWRSHPSSNLGIISLRPRRRAPRPFTERSPVMFQTRLWFLCPPWCPFSKTKRTWISVSAQGVAQPADALQWRRTSFENNLVFINQQEFSVWGPSAGIKKRSTCGPGLLSENRQVASLGCTEEQISYGSGMSAPCFQFQWHLAGFCMLKFRLNCLKCRQQATHLLCSVAL